MARVPLTSRCEPAFRKFVLGARSWVGDRSDFPCGRELLLALQTSTLLVSPPPPHRNHLNSSPPPSWCRNLCAPCTCFDEGLNYKSFDVGGGAVVCVCARACRTGLSALGARWVYTSPLPFLRSPVRPRLPPPPSLSPPPVLFNVFDVSGSGLISKKEFSSMAQAVIVGGRTLSWDHVGGGRAAAPSVGFEFFKPMADMMVEMAMLEV
jgi:hypothetical protein